MRRPRTETVVLVETCLLALWLGAALFFAAIVAPAAFAVLPAPALAGALVGRVLPSLFIGGIIVSLLILALEAGVPRRGGRFRALGAGVMLIACTAAQFVIAGRIERLRVAAGAPMDALSRDDPRRVTFGRLHALSVAALGAAMVAAVAVAATARIAPPARG
jgi:hypothetical protein